MKDLIQKIKDLESFYNTSYYIFHLKKPLYRCFKDETFMGIPYCIKQLCNEVNDIIKESKLTQLDIFKYISNYHQYFWVSQKILFYTLPKDFSYNDIYDIACGEKDLPNNIIIDDDLLACVVTCFVLDTFRYNDLNIASLILHEKYIYDITDYKLTKVQGVEFKQNGFIYNKKFYLYSIFIDITPLNPIDFMPAIFKVMLDNLDFNNIDFYLRLDERLAIPLEYAKIGYDLGFEKWRGCTFDFSNTKLENLKNIIVHSNNNNNKLLMVIKIDYDAILNEEFWHIEIEEIPYIDRDSTQFKNVITTFIHGKYYPGRKTFRHIDFIKNQYPLKDYCCKQLDKSTNKIKIDFYTTKECHYKIWCIENQDIKENVWVKLVRISLKDQYRQLFDEILESTK